MPLLESTNLELGMSAPSFTLPNQNPLVDAENISLAELQSASGTLIAFICNHCPYVVHLKESFSTFAKEYQEKGLQVVAISANDPETYPADAPGKMAEDSVSFDYSFPYLFDETQETAKSYAAVCTPEFYLFDSDMRLAYHGQYDDSRPNNQKPVTGEDLRAAADAIIAGRAVSANQKHSAGCSIKWKRGNES